MAVVFRGLADEAIDELCTAMLESGERLDLSSLGRRVVDKHSTGGVGDKTTIALAPLVAACDVPVAKMSGRGLAHTGGTLDKLEAIPGFRVGLETDELIEQVRRIGVAVAAQSASLAPGGRRHLRAARRDGHGAGAGADRDLGDEQEARRRGRRDPARRQGRRRRLLSARSRRPGRWHC